MLWPRFINWIWFDFMTDFRQIQLDELTALQAIFTEDLELTPSKNAWDVQPLISFRIHIYVSHTSLFLHITFPRTYPSVPPSYSLKQVVGMSPNQQKRSGEKDQRKNVTMDWPGNGL